MSERLIKVIIANRPYRLKVNSEEEEEILRKSVRKIETLLDDYSNQFHFKDFQDLLAMISLDFANKSLSLQKQIGYKDHEMVNQLTEIDAFLTSKIK